MQSKPLRSCSPKSSVSSGEEVEDAGLGRVGKEEATGSLEIGDLCVADGPIEVEKGSRIAAAGSALTAGLYIIAARVNVDSRISTWTSSIPF
jgi:hypothetical protein